MKLLMKRFMVGAALAVLAVVTGADAAAGQVGLLKDGRLGVDNLAFELSVFTRQWQHLGSTGSGGTFQVLARGRRGIPKIFATGSTFRARRPVN